MVEGIEIERNVFVDDLLLNVDIGSDVSNLFVESGTRSPSFVIAANEEERTPRRKTNPS